MLTNVKAFLRILFMLGVCLILNNSVLAQSIADDVDQRFADLKDKFSKLATTSFGQENSTTWAIPSAYISKQFLVRSLSSGVANAGITVSVILPPHSFEAKPVEVTTGEQQEIPCDADQGCNSNCGDWDLKCKWDKGWCEADKAQKKLGCEAKKTAQQTISHKKLLTVFLYDDAGNPDSVKVSGAGNARVLGLNLSDDLTHAELATSVSAAVRVTAKVRTKFESAIKAALLVITGNPGCLLDQDTFINNQPVSVDHPDLRLPISISKPGVEDDQIKFDLQFEKTTVLLKFDSHPVAKLLASDVRNLLTLLPCPLPILSVTAVEEFFPNDFMKKDQDLPPISQTEKIGSIHAPVLGHDYKLQPLTTDLAWGVRADRRN
jgi:hypothetical protein